MVEVKTKSKSKSQSQPQHSEYFVGEVAQNTPQGRLLVEVVASPGGTALSPNQAMVEILNNQLAIKKFLQERL
jgi:hypothetical protein